MRKELHAWCTEYNKDLSPISWQFQTKDSRTKLKRLYPDISKFYRERDERREGKVSPAG